MHVYKKATLPVLGAVLLAGSGVAAGLAAPEYKEEGIDLRPVIGITLGIVGALVGATVGAALTSETREEYTLWTD